MKRIRNMMVAGIVLFSVVVTAQEKKEKPLFETQGTLVKATYYHENGQVAQTGFYKDNKLHGTWKSYDQNGNHKAIAIYNEGKKTGKWFFWNGEKVSEVDYLNNKIVGITELEHANPVVVNK